MKAIILCGGLGTRLRPLTDKIPKVMVPIGGKPLIEYHIQWLSGNGIKDIGVNLFHLPEAVSGFLGDGSKHGVRIYYSKQSALKGTAGDFLQFKEFIGKDRCLVIYGDNLFKMDLDKFIRFHEKKGGLASIALKKWEDPTSKGIVGLDKKGKIMWFKEKPKLEEAVTDIGNAGIYILEPEIFDHIPEGVESDFGRDIFPSAIGMKEELYGYILDDYHADIGTPQVLESVQKEISDLLPKKAAFLDRDGVLDKKPPEHDYVKKFSEFHWNEGAFELIKGLKSRGYDVVIISNQRGVALKKMTKRFVDSLHARMKKEAKKAGADIDAFYYCPHDKPEDCTCRKPKPGLLFRAAFDMSIDLGKSIMIGDSKSDMEAAKRAGCRGISVETDDLDIDRIFSEIDNEQNGL